MSISNYVQISLYFSSDNDFSANDNRRRMDEGVQSNAYEYADTNKAEPKGSGRSSPVSNTKQNLVWKHI